MHMPSPLPWADEPYALIPLPKQTPSGKPHFILHAVREMAHVHNVLLRSLNAIVVQGPQIPDSPDHTSYSRKDIADFLFYVVAWTKTVEHHHHSEETVLFPEIAKLAGEPGIMSHAEEQHAEFHDGLLSLHDYAEKCLNEIQIKPAKTQSPSNPTDGKPQYMWNELKVIVESFAQDMRQHLCDEIDILLQLERLDEKGLQVCWDKTEKAAKESGGLKVLYDIFPLVLGARDITFDGGNSFPPLPAIVPFAIKHWFSRRNAGAWRFSPCDFDGNPRPLAFAPAAAAVSA